MKKIINTFLTLCCLGIAAVSLFYAYQYWQKYQKANKTYEEMQKEYTKEKKKKKGLEGKWMEIDWKKLKKRNPNIVGWIYMVSGANYPIVQGESYEEYLHTDPYGDYSINGSIMLNCDNKKDFTDKNTVIYGHNMRNGSMFGSNKKYQDKDYAKKHKYFYIFTPKGRYRYKIYQTHTIYDATDIYRVDFYDDKDFDKWLKERKDGADYTVGDQVVPEDRVMTLSTCTSNGKKRFAIQGYLKEFETYDHKEHKDRKDLQRKLNYFTEE